MDSGFHRPKLPGFRIPDYLTWGDGKQALEIKRFAKFTLVRSSHFLTKDDTL